MTRSFSAELRLNPSDGRVAHRAAVGAPASFFAMDQQRSLCRIDNLSATGARLRLFDRIDRRAEIELKLPGDLVRRARIVWTDELECGCAFDEPLPEAALNALVAAFADPDEDPRGGIPISKS